jgi:hypothetical protein
MTVQQSSPPQQGHGIGGLLVLGLLVASHRLRRGLGWIAVGLVVLGAPVPAGGGHAHNHGGTVGVLGGLAAAQYVRNGRITDK